MLGDVNKLFVFKFFCWRGILPLHLKQTFPPVIWIFTEGGGDGIESRLPFKIFSTLHWYMVARLEVRAQNPTLLHGSQHERFFFAILLFLPLNFVFFLTQWKQYNHTFETNVNLTKKKFEVMLITVNITCSPVEIWSFRTSESWKCSSTLKLSKYF